MKPNLLLLRTLAVFLILALGLPAAVHPEPVKGYALRVQAGLESDSGPQLETAIAAGVEEWPQDFPYERLDINEVPELRDRLMALGRLDRYRGRLLRKKQGDQRYIIDFQTKYSEAIDRDGVDASGVRLQDLLEWPTKAHPALEYLVFRLARALHANVPDIVIPSTQEAKVIHEALEKQGYPVSKEPNVYLERLTMDYRTGDPQVFQADFRKTFTRSFVVAFLVRNYDLSMRNFGILANSNEPLMWFDYERSFSEESLPLENFLFRFSQESIRGEKAFLINRGKLVRQLDLEELALALKEVEQFSADQFAQDLLRDLPENLKGHKDRIGDYLNYIRKTQPVIRLQMREFFSILGQKEPGPFMDGIGGPVVFSDLFSVEDKLPGAEFDWILQVLDNNAGPDRIPLEGDGSYREPGSAAGAEEKKFSRRYLLIATVLGLGAVGAGFLGWKWRQRVSLDSLILPPREGGVRRLRDFRGFQPVPDINVETDTVIFHAQSETVLRLNLGLTQVFRPETRFIFIVPSRETASAALQSLSDLGLANIGQRVRFLIVRSRFVDWGRDPFVPFVNPVTRQYALIPARTTIDGSGHGLSVASDLSGAETGLDLFLGEPPLASLDIHGGDFLSDSQQVYVGDSTLVRSTQQFPLLNRLERRAEAQRSLQELMRRNVIFLNETNSGLFRNSHADTFFMPLGQTRAGASTVVLGDIRMTLRILRQLTPQERETAVQAILGQVSGFSTERGIRAINAESVRGLLSLQRFSEENLRNFEDGARQMDALEEALGRSGISVRRVPYLPGSREEGTPFGIYHANVITEILRMPDGSQDRTIVMPIYSIEALDRAAEAVYSDLGFRVVRFMGGVTLGAFFAGPHCLCQRLGVPLNNAGAEENRLVSTLDLLGEAAPQGPGVLVIEAGEISRRTGLEEFATRVPPNLAKKLLIFGKGSAAALEAGARSGIRVVDSDRLSDLAVQLSGMEEADRIGYVGDPVRAGNLSSILPVSMQVTPMEPGTTLSLMLGYLGYPDAILSAINAAGMEELFAGARAA